MRNFVLILLLSGFSTIVFSQSTVKIKLKDNQSIKGQWEGMKDDQYLVQQENGSIIYVPQDVVLKLKLYRSYQDYPRYDGNRSTVFCGWSGDLTTTLGQEDRNFHGAGINGLIGYDWNHQYSLEASMGYRNMNIGKPETFLPVSLTAKKYLTHGRYLFYGGVEAGYHWGIKNRWETPDEGNDWLTWNSHITWYQPRHDHGSGPSLTPLIGVRKIGKYGWDHILSLGLHIQRFQSEQLNGDDPISSVDILYQRWRLSYGMIF